jgi:hypothetical protein
VSRPDGTRGLRYNFHRGQLRAWRSPKRTVLRPVYFGHASDPDSLESATAKAAWLDEAGPEEVPARLWEAIQRRLSIHQGRALITTTPYDLGWLKQKLWDPWQAPKRRTTRRSTSSASTRREPGLPRRSSSAPAASCRAGSSTCSTAAIFTRPAGLIYSSFDENRTRCPRFAVPPTTGSAPRPGLRRRQHGRRVLRRGARHGRLYAYREYLAGGRTAKEHAEELLEGRAGRPGLRRRLQVGGQWRDEFRAGLPVHEPASADVEVGIDRVYGATSRRRAVRVRRPGRVLDELGSYSREVDDAGEPTEKIEAKETYHRLDAVHVADVAADETVVQT